MGKRRAVGSTNKRTRGGTSRGGAIGDRPIKGAPAGNIFNKRYNVPIKVPEAPRLIRNSKPIVPKKKQNFRSQHHRSETYNGNGQFQRIVYGEVKDVGGILVFWQALPNGSVIVKYDISIGPIFSITNLRLEDKPIANWGIVSEVKLGTPTQTISSIFNTLRTGWIPTRYPGIAHVILHIPGTVAEKPDIFQFKCDVKGKLLLDPTQDVTLATKFFSEDPSLIIADLIVSKRYGARADNSIINWTMLKDVTVPFCTGTSIDGSGTKRYPIGIIIDENQHLDSAVELIRLHAQLYVSFYDGQYNIWPDTVKTFSGITLTDDDLLADPNANYYRTKGSSEVFDKLTVGYTDSDNGWVDKNVELERPGIASLSVPIESFEIDLRATRKEQQAIRIGTYLIKRNLKDKIYFFGTPFQKGIKIVPGDWIKLTESDNINVSLLDVVITQVDILDGDYQYQAEVYDPTIFSDTIVTQITQGSPAVISHYDVPPAPLSPAGLATLSIGDGFDVQPEGVNVTWSYPGHPHEVRFKITEQEAGGSELVLHSNYIGYGPYFIKVGTVLKTIRIYAFVATTLVSSVALTGTADPADVYPSYDVVNPRISFGSTPTKPNILRWDDPQIRTFPIYGASFWSGTASITGANVNNQDASVNAVTFTNGQTLILDHGVGQGKNLREVRIKATTEVFVKGLGLYFDIEYSNNGTSWTAVPNVKELMKYREGVGGATNEIVYQWDSIGIQRFIRLTAVCSGSKAISEVQFAEFLITFSNIDHINIYDVRDSGTQTLVGSIDYSLDYVTQPFFIGNDLITATSTEKYASLLLKIVNKHGVESEGVGANKAQIYSTSSSEAVSTQSNTLELFGKTINLLNNILTGTKIEFNAALSDDDFVFIGAATNTLTGILSVGAAPKTGQKFGVFGGEIFFDYSTGGVTGGAAMRFASNANQTFYASNQYFSGGLKRARAGGTSMISFDTTTGANAGDIIFTANGTDVADSIIANTERLRVKGSTGNLSIGGTIITLGNGRILSFGSGTPEGVLTASVGSLHLRSDGGANTTLYVKESGTGNTGWVAK